MRAKLAARFAVIPVVLNLNQIHVWPVRLNAVPPKLNLFELLLSADEAERAARFKFERDRRSFVTSRGALRILLGRYLQRAPETLRFAYQPNGKPRLATASTVSFNLSHSGSIALFAFGNDLEIGVDVEALRTMKDLNAIAKRFFCDDECKDLFSLPALKQEPAFFHCWTRKEAYIKATGEGLSAPLDQFRVTLRPQDPARLVYIRNLHEAQEWSMHDIDFDPAYVAAIAYRGAERKLQLMPTLDASEVLHESS